MKKLFFLAVIATSLAACGGWNDEKRAEVKSECAKTVGNLYTKEDAAKICDCVSTKINEKFPKAELEESYNQVDISADSLAKALDAQLTEEMSKLPK